MAYLSVLACVCVYTNQMACLGCRAECHNYFKKALYYFGEIGGNDYFAMFVSNKGVTEILAFVPQVIEQINLSLQVK